MTIYEYGPAAWLWRIVIAFFLALASLFLVTGRVIPLVLLSAFALAVPAIFFGLVVAVRVDLHDDDVMEVWTLLFVRRRIPRVLLGPPRVRRMYQSLYGNLSAPRVWVPVRGSLPIYFDLLGRIGDRPALLSAIKLNASELRVAD